MRPLRSALGRAAALVLLCALFSNRAQAVPGIATPEVLATTVGANEAGTDNTQFIFRAIITPSSNTVALVTTGPNRPRVVIDPFDGANPEFGGAATFFMSRRGPTANEWVAYVPGGSMNGGSGPPNFGTHSWSIVAQETPATDGTLMNGTGAAPKPAPQTIRVLPSADPSTISLTPVVRNADGSYTPDKRLIPGQLGNGLRVDPEDPTNANNGGSSHFYTFRVRVNTPGGLPSQYFMRREQFEWRDHRYDQPPLASDGTIGSGFLNDNYNSGVMLVLLDPAGNSHFCPMELDPEAPNGAINQAGLARMDTRYPDRLRHPQSDNIYSTAGVYYRYRMMPTQYMFNWNSSLPGEGPFTRFGGPTSPDSLPAIPIGFNIGQTPVALGPEVIGRPFANVYTGFAARDQTGANFGQSGNPGTATAYPFYTVTNGRTGQWKYFFIATTDLRPVPRGGGFSSNGDINTYPDDRYGADIGAYGNGRDSDDAGNPVFNFQPYGHPYVGVMLSDGGWTDDIPENGFAGTRGNSWRSRVTTKTRVRFMVRVTKPDETPLPLQAVRIYIDDVQHTMQPLPNVGDLYANGKRFYYDTTFANPGDIGQHRIFFMVDAGANSPSNYIAIWPRRDWGAPGVSQGTGDGRYTDPQSLLAPYGTIDSTPISFGSLNQVGKNYLLEPLVNSRPVLSNPAVNPQSGIEGQPFTFSVNYQDADGDAPLDSTVVVDGISYRMTVDASVQQPVNYRQPTKFVFTLTLPQNPDGSPHSYFFKFRDNWNNFQVYGISSIRRESGEWSTLPLGNDNGVPSSLFAGPVITGNHPAELLEPSFSFSDPAQTSATLYDFVVKYRDSDNQPPASIRMYISADGGATYDTGTALVPAEASTNYVVGVLYHLPNRIQLPVGNQYRYKFVASDGVQPANTTLIRVGSGVNFDATAHELKPTGVAKQYGDPNGGPFNPGTKKWDNTNQVLLFSPNPVTGVIGLLDPIAFPYVVDHANGTVTFTGAVPSQVFASYYYTEAVGPTVNANRPPVLSAPDVTKPNGDTLSPTGGTPTTNFVYKVVYKDPDNQAPSPSPAYINVVIDNNRTVALTAATGQTLPLDYTRGVTFVSPNVNLAVGTHIYHFEASDGAAITRLDNGGKDYDGPVVTDPSNLVTPLIQPFPKGKSNDNYTFTVTYQSPQGSAPPTGGIQVKLTPVAPAAPGQGTITAQMNAIDPLDFTKPVRYQVQLTATSTPGLNNLLPGAYSVVFAFTSNPSSGTAPQTLIVNGKPTLSNATATPNPQSRSGDVTFSVKYQDVNGDLPVDKNGANTMNLFIDGKLRSETPVVTPGTTPAQIKAGVTYTWTIPANDISTVAGTFPVRFEASDDLETAVGSPISPAGGNPAGTITITNAALPVLAGPTPGNPATNDGTVTPLKGAFGGTYTYRVVYKHADNVAPTTIQLLIDPGKANSQTIDLQPEAGQTQPYNYANGVTYAYTTTAGSLASGAHAYSFTVSDRLNTTTMPATGTFTGPTVNFVPTLTNATASLVGGTASTVDNTNTVKPAILGNTTNKFVFTVTYKDTDYKAGDPAPSVKLTIGSGQPIVLTPVGANPNYVTGAVFTTNPVGMTLAPGDIKFHFDATDSLDPVRLPATAGTDITGIKIANVASLDKPSAITTQDPFGGIVSPLSGPLSQTFTYKVLYKNADGTAPSFVNAVIDEATKKVIIPMTQAASGGDFKAGVVYQGTYRFNTCGVHTVHFEAADTVSPTYIAQYPVPVAPATTAPISAPTVNEASFQAATFNPTKPVISQPVTVGSKLITVPLRSTQIAVKLVRPDGTGVNDTVTTAADGTLAYTFTPTQTGDWRIQLSWAGQTGVYDPVMQEFAFAVTGFTLPLNAAQQDMIAIPLIPVTPDPALSFGVTDTNGNPLAVTVLNVIQWSPPLGRYLSLNQDGNFPGITAGKAYWVKPTQAVVLNPRGRVADQTQPYAIPLSTGWNMIGSVFLEDINWSAVKVRVNGQDINIADAEQYVRPVAWDYNKQTGGYEMVTLPNGVLHSGRGYWVKAFANVDLVLAPPGSRAAVEGRDAVARATSLQIMAQAGKHVDRDNYAPLTSAGNSRLALQEKPPYVSEHVSIHFVTDKVELPAESRASAASASNLVFFDVETDQKNTDVSVQFPNLSAIGRKTEVTLLDMTSNNRRALGTGTGVTYNTGANAAPRRFALIMNTAAINTRLVISGMQSAGGNSRSPALSFQYSISGAATVKAQIVGGASGQTIRTLDSGRAVPQGTNSLLWDGKDAKGVSVAAGSYLLKLTATDEKGHTATGIMPVTVVR
jgi:hypothetical protein